MNSLSDLKPLAAAEWDPQLGRVIADMHGRPLNVHGLMALNPAMLAAWWPFRNHSVRGGSLTARQRELLILRVAWQLDCWYEWASHVERGLAAGLAIEEIQRVKAGGGDRRWAADDSALLAAVDDCIVRKRIGADTLEKLQPHFDGPQVLDAIAICGTYQMLGAMINTWEPELDAFIELPDGTDRASWKQAPR
ncbi:MAG: carboxymuconolactone decarboxylase family protein [Woeseiaceae bacterium]